VFTLAGSAAGVFAALSGVGLPFALVGPLLGISLDAIRATQDIDEVGEIEDQSEKFLLPRKEGADETPPEEDDLDLNSLERFAKEVDALHFPEEPFASPDEDPGKTDSISSLDTPASLAESHFAGGEDPSFDSLSADRGSQAAPSALSSGFGPSGGPSLGGEAGGTGSSPGGGGPGAGAGAGSGGTGSGGGA
jgi:hypothetical protein